MIKTQPHMTKAGRAAFVALLAVLSLSGCSDARRAMGWDKSPPDEFAVVSRAPLSQPPDYTLRPPMPGAPRPQEGTSRDMAKSVLVPGIRPSASASLIGNTFSDRSQGEQSLLKMAGASNAPPDIRRKVNEETTSMIEADKSFTDQILFWQTKPPPGEPVDASKEQKRLQENASLGKSSTDGDSPQIVRKQKGWLEGIF
ncbi:MAG TPA: DUF3035 domain-containing protein [Patescibacteria group bacterium]|nr:DUF3035 domain-containing protein [Patescibacteria group bacterium]